MPKTKLQESVLHEWVHELPFQMQALLLTAMRGPDENNKYNAAKAIIRYLRGTICKPAGHWNGKNNNDFMWGEYDSPDMIKSYNGHPVKSTTPLFSTHADAFWQDHDEYPHHFIMHLVHCAEVIGYKHPDCFVRKHWLNFYRDACKAFHMNPESEPQLENRLNDFGVGVHNMVTEIIKEECPQSLPKG